MNKLIISVSEGTVLNINSLPSIRAAFNLNKVDLAKCYAENAKRGKRQVVAMVVSK